jgi:hypothetical protein
MKLIKWILFLAVLGALAYFTYRWYRQDVSDLKVLSLVPPTAVYLFETSSPINSWKSISGSLQWQHLQKNKYFASLTSSVNALDSLIHDNDLLFQLLGSRSVIVSTHMVSTRDYDFLFVVDLQEASLISVLQEYLTSFSGKGYSVTKDKYQNEQLILVRDASNNKTLHLFMKGPFLVGSYNRTLVTSSIDASIGDNLLNSPAFQNNPETDDEGLVRIYINYPRLPAYTSIYTSGQNEYVKRFSSALQFSHLTFSLDHEEFRITGLTTINDTIESYVRSLHTSGKGPTDITQVAPQRTAFYLGLGFGSFGEFFKNFETNLKTDVTEYAAYRENVKQVEDYLKIDIQKNIIDWIGDEVAILELPSAGSGIHNEAAVVLKAHNIEAAKDNLSYIEKMVRKRTPVKFKTFDHRGYSINYLSVKGLFNILLGKFFARYDKPYYTIINNFVIFSNNPESLKGIINDYLDKKTLARSEDFRTFRKEFDDESSVFIYLHAPNLFNTAVNLANPTTRVSMVENKEFIICFRDIGMQLTPVERGFESIIAEQFVEPPSRLVIEPKAEEVELPAEPTPEEKIETDPMALPELYAENPNVKEFIGYFPDSTIQFKVQIRNGFKDGDYTEYHPNRKTKMMGKFSKDKRDGTWRLYNEEGDLILRREYRNDQVTRERVKD